MHACGDDDAMGGYSVPDAEKCRLAEAWRHAGYEAMAASEWRPLRVGVRADALEACMPAHAYLLITAWNPHGRVVDAQANANADLRLRLRLDALGFTGIPALAHDGDGGWREPGWLALDASAAQADALAREFGQGGVLHWHAGEPVGLRLTWARPAHAPEWPDVIWTG